MSDTKCEVCERTVSQSETVQYKGVTVCKDCMREYLLEKKKGLVRGQWIPIVLYGLPNILFLIAIIILVAVPAPKPEALSSAAQIMVSISAVWALIAAGVITAKKKTFLSVGEPESSMTTVNVYDDAAYGKTSANYSGSQWAKVFVNLFVFTVVLVYIIFLGTTFYFVHLIKIGATSSKLKKLTR